MPDLRAYCRPAEAEPKVITLTAEESHHLVVVNRAHAGDLVVAFDGRGREWLCELTGTQRKAAVLTVRERRVARTLPYEITLAQALPKGAVMDTIVRKATELGAARIVPLESERTQVHLEAERSDRKLEKWCTAAVEAAKQCGNPFVPEIAPIQPFESFVAERHTNALKLIASLHPGAQSLKAVLAQYGADHGRRPGAVICLVGPEGDFTSREVTVATEAGFKPITLGSLVLRCDTAATYLLSVLAHELQTPASGVELQGARNKAPETA